MAGHVIHVGVDYWQRTTVLRRAGLRPQLCKDPRTLRTVLAGTGTVDAVLISESPDLDVSSATEIVRRETQCPVILFPVGTNGYDETKYDLIVPSLTPPDQWISSVWSLIEHSQQVKARSQEIRAGSQELRRQSAEVRESSRRERERSERILEAQRPKLNLATLPGNTLLSSLSEDSRVSLLRHASAVELPLHTELYEESTVPRYAHFLLSGLASVVASMPNGESVEVGFIGREGLVGSLQLLGRPSVSTRCMMQIAGSGLRVPFAEVQQAFDHLPEIRRRILEFVHQQSAVLAQVAACNRMHDATHRLIRWLLMAQDRTGGDTLNFTQEYLSEMIGTQRTTVTVIAGDLQRRGMVRYSRGRIYILDRAAMEAAACVCDGIIRQLFRGLYQQG